MAHRLKRAWISRTAVAAAVVASSFVVVGVAQAAIAGAPPETTTSRPALTSATVLSGTAVDFCFNQSVASSTLTGGNFLVGGYRAERAVPATSAALEQGSSANTPAFNCVRATFPATVGDIDQYTVGTVLGSAVTSPNGNSNTFGDSSALTGSDTHNGTTGLTIAPDLSGVLVDTTSNTIQYTEDQAVGNVITGADFSFTDGGGNTCTALPAAASASGNVVTVSFAGNTCGPVPVGAPVGTLGAFEPVSNAVRASQKQGAILAAADPTISNTDDTVAVPNAPNGGQTARPDLISAVLEPNGGAIDFTFDSNVTVPLPPLATGVLGVGGFRADLSTGDEIPGQSATLIAVSTTSTTIRVTFPNLTSYDEYVVKGSVMPGAVLGAGVAPATVGLNTPGSAPAGDNAGAFARGFTTGADAFSAVLNRTTGVASILLDQRAFASRNPGNIMLLDSNGNPIIGATGAGVSLPTQGAGPQIVTVQFAPSQIATAANIAIENNNASVPTLAGSAFETGVSASGVGTNQPNVDQILAPTTTSALLKASQAAAKAKPVSGKVVARTNARLRSASRARLAKLRSEHQRSHKHHKSHKKHRRA